MTISMLLIYMKITSYDTVVKASKVNSKMSPFGATSNDKW